ncbi:hypothetical protein Back11_38620 [Paenibacillus baekrokdamisoli]|uniref:VanZ-like domain-containing protein n=1 Tax=Paenibacillus baekrokdamisoli TaxID=1712516 RepID=A0A3G9IUF9_9BACL|nr:VanZ family protein [Paenibacillus baekrokdamisoli]MBB3068438.1 glycopeptide antibiotics resistance protein [Paenibacillus baekrokdamisoli]BBH22517.1 hypothetical protein Back11_38620 [Paenibacillus baekrokdamisoli]
MTDHFHVAINQIRFGRFIVLFILAILVLETLQSLTHLGAFDVDDVISNTLGGAIGYVVYRAGFSSTIITAFLMQRFTTREL